MLTEHQSTVGHDVGIAILTIIIIAMIITVAVLGFRRFARHRRRLRFSTIKSPFGSSTGVNFVTMMEEPETDFQPRDRQLEIIGTTPNAS